MFSTLGTHDTVKQGYMALLNGYYFTPGAFGPFWQLKQPLNWARGTIILAPHISQEIIDLYDNKPNAIRSFGLRIAPLLTSANINKEQIETHSVSEIPSWCIRKPTIDLSLHSEKKSESNPYLLK